MTTRTLTTAFAQRRIVGGAMFAWVSVVLLLIVEQVVAATSATPYSFTRGNISDLGEQRCTSGALCANAFQAMNAAIVVTGILMATGAILFCWARRITIVAAGLYLLAGGLVVGIGVVPQNVDLKLHQAIALAAFLFVNLAPICATIRLGTATLDNAVVFTVAALFVVGCLGLYAYSSGNGMGMGLGVTERMAAYSPLASTVLLGWRLRYSDLNIRTARGRHGAVT